MNDESVPRLYLDDKEIILIGTAHVSKQSVDEVKNVIEKEKPDTVCVELDQQRYNSIVHQNRWQQMDIFKVIREKKSTFLLINLMVSAFQKRIAKQFNIKPGQEMIQAIESAKSIDATLILADRNIQVTFLRIWHGIGLKGKVQLLTSILFGFFDEEEITEETLESLKAKDTLTSMLGEFTEAFPRLKAFLVDERDCYLAQKIKEAPGKKIVAVLGAAHVPGVTREIYKEHDLNALTKLPKKSNKPRFISWLIPIIIIGIIASTYYFSRSAAKDLTLSWILWNSILSALGTILAFGHILTIITSLLIAPFTSLNPFFGAGWVAGLVEAFIRRPHVKDFEDLSEDIFTLKGFWKNKVTRILLVVIFTNIGSVVGSFIGGADVLRIFLRTIKGP
ncbi:pheromone shutdown-related protein TraB [Natronincola peptidivorans]|uniref:Pheromone shutdown-related protein TraB n=1 Tax=Natronincola peptidivorans TaxID=426128 RepID=A0A1I0DKB0_9FIRM|nr:TraB/GumN family protein [Natronincola peptidivorans]SET32698.1 pheromone shutdown-related protein TraB [Natronincola peptidivorans]